MQLVIVTTIISVVVSIITAAFVVFIGCCSFKIYMEREIGDIGEKMIELAKESIRNAYSNK